MPSLVSYDMPMAAAVAIAMYRDVYVMVSVLWRRIRSAAHLLTYHSTPHEVLYEGQQAAI